MIEDCRWAELLFPGLRVEVACVRDAEGAAAEAELVAAERALVRDAVPARVRAFALGRRAAHRALTRAKAPSGPILAGANRAPRWPAGFVGSIAHCEGIAIAAVARADAVQGLGVDVEVARGLTTDLWSRVLTPHERAALAALPAAERADAALRVFCAKEAIYKAWSLRGQRVIEFQDVELAALPTANATSATQAHVATPPRARADVRVGGDDVYVFAAAHLDFGARVCDLDARLRL